MLRRIDIELIKRYGPLLPARHQPDAEAALDALRAHGNRADEAIPAVREVLEVIQQQLSGGWRPQVRPVGEDFRPQDEPDRTG